MSKHEWENEHEIDNATHCYVALCKCGGWFHVAVDTPTTMKGAGKHFARYMREGSPVERVTLDNFRAGKPPMCGCKTEAKKEREK